MRGVIALITGVFTIAIMALVAGVVLEPLADITLGSSAVQALGWGNDVVDIRDTILRWSILLGILYFVVWAAMYAIRREKMSEVRRR